MICHVMMMMSYAFCHAIHKEYFSFFNTFLSFFNVIVFIFLFHFYFSYACIYFIMIDFVIGEAEKRAWQVCGRQAVQRR